MVLDLRRRRTQSFVTSAGLASGSCPLLPAYTLPTAQTVRPLPIRFASPTPMPGPALQSCCVPLAPFRPVTLVIPVLVQRALRATVTRRPGPLMTAARAASPCGKGVPHGLASLEWGFRSAGRIAAPLAGPGGTPCAQWTANSAEGVATLLVGFTNNDPVRYPVVSQEQVQ